LLPVGFLPRGVGGLKHLLFGWPYPFAEVSDPPLLGGWRVVHLRNCYSQARVTGRTTAIVSPRQLADAARVEL